MTSIADSGKKRGRPSTGIGKPIGLRLYPELERRIDAWLAARPDPKPSRPEAIRQLVEVGLGAPTQPSFSELLRAYFEAAPERLGPWGADEGTSPAEHVGTLLDAKGSDFKAVRREAARLAELLEDEEGLAAARLRGFLLLLAG